MAQEVTCRFCKKKINKSMALKVGDRSYYCNETCHKKQEDKIKYKPSKVKSDGQINERRKVTDWIMEYYVSQGVDKHDINWGLITAQLKNIMEEKVLIDDEMRNLKYSGILLTLKYLVDIEGKNLLNNESGSVLGLVPSNYIRAKNDYLKTKEIEKAINEFDFNDDVVVIKKNVDKKSKYKEIDIEKL